MRYLIPYHEYLAEITRPDMQEDVAQLRDVPYRILPVEATLLESNSPLRAEDTRSRP